jgi:hypothetical protein
MRFRAVQLIALISEAWMTLGNFHITRLLTAATLALLFVTCDVLKPGRNWTQFTEETVEASLEALAEADSIYIAVKAEQGIPAAAVAARAKLADHPSVAKAGISEDATVWAFFRSGFVGCVAEQDRGTRESALPTASPANRARISEGGEAIPLYYVLVPFAHEFGTTTEDSIIAMLDSLDGGSGWFQTVVYRDTQVNVPRVAAALALGPGVLYWSGHGAICLRDTITYEFWSVLATGETYGSNAMAWRLVNCYQGGVLASGADRELVVTMSGRRYYLAITPRFVSVYGHFDVPEEEMRPHTKSLAYIDCCWSWEPVNQHLQNAFIDAGVDAYVGWDGTVDASVTPDASLGFFRGATDTMTVTEAYHTIAGVTDPSSGAKPRMSGENPMMMITSQMRFIKDGVKLRGYDVGAAEHFVDVYWAGVNCRSWGTILRHRYIMGVIFPAGTGSYDCVKDTNAELFLYDSLTDEGYAVKWYECAGVQGRIEVNRYDVSGTSGTFSGTLGHWADSADRRKDPPIATVQVSGFFKTMGWPWPIHQAGVQRVGPEGVCVSKIRLPLSVWQRTTDGQHKGGMDDAR